MPDLLLIRIYLSKVICNCLCLCFADQIAECFFLLLSLIPGKAHTQIQTHRIIIVD